MPVSSLPSKYGIGCFSRSAYEFVDKLKRARQGYWQILPLGPTSYGDSPYQSFSTFAGNPYFIDLEELIGEGLLTRQECSRTDMGKEPSSIDYGKLYKGRFKLLKKAFSRWDKDKEEGFEAFCEEEKEWLPDYALYMAVKERFDNAPWSEWAEDIRLRWDNAMDYYRHELENEILFYKFLQFRFFRQWRALKAYANENGIRIIGDIPIYVAMDSADTWANPGLFKLDQENRPTLVAGCPPDAFAPTGQLWGNPLYAWDVHEKDGFAWWTRRAAHCFKMYDVVRIDHFRGFDEYYAIPYGDPTAEHGWWEKGPGIRLFNALKAALGEKDIIAEDLGFMTDSVRALVRDTGYPNMKVLEFAFDSRDTSGKGDYLPHNYGRNCVVYTGTHDNETLHGWLLALPAEERRAVIAYLNRNGGDVLDIVRDLICLALMSVAKLAIIPMQDYLGLDNRARINQPGTLGTNWKWRMKEDAFTDELADEMAGMAGRYGRA